MGKRLKTQLPLYLDARTIARLTELTARRGCTMQAVLREAVANTLRGAARAGLIPKVRPASPVAPVSPARPRIDPELRTAQAAFVGLEFTMLHSMARTLDPPGPADKPPITVEELIAQEPGPAIDVERRAAEAEGAAVLPPVLPRPRTTTAEPRRFTVDEILRRLAPPPTPPPPPPEATSSRPLPK